MFKIINNKIKKIFNEKILYLPFIMLLLFMPNCKVCYVLTCLFCNK